MVAQAGGGDDGGSGGSPAALIAGLVSAAAFGCCVVLSTIGLVVLIVTVSSARKKAATASRGSLAGQDGVELGARVATDAEALPEALPSYADAGSERLPSYGDASDGAMFGAPGTELGTIDEATAGGRESAGSRSDRGSSLTLDPIRPRGRSFGLADVVGSVRRFSARAVNRARSSMAHLQPTAQAEAGFGGNVRFSADVRATRLEAVLPRGWTRVIDKGGLVWYQNSYTGKGSVDVPDLPAVPDGFTALQDEEGYVYYVDDETQSTSWDHPHRDDLHRGEDVTFGAPQHLAAEQVSSWGHAHSGVQDAPFAEGFGAPQQLAAPESFGRRESEEEFSFVRNSLRSDLKLTL